MKQSTLRIQWEPRTQCADRQLLPRSKSAELPYHFNVAIFPVKVFCGKSNILLHYFPISGISPAGLSSGIFSKVQYHCLTHHLPRWPDILDTDLSTNRYVAQGHHSATGLWHLRDSENTEVSTQMNTHPLGSTRMASPELLVFLQHLLGGCKLHSPEKFPCLPFSDE